MKKIISTILVCVLLASTMLLLVSCGGAIEDGTYVNRAKGAEIEISGNTLVINKTAGDETESGTYTYEIKDDENNSAKQNIVLTPDFEGDVVTFSYEKLEDGFVINGTKYTKK
ncbi:MAG: hypothetical protein IJX92_02110 [Clostridia bacterium]|nr:hypothetical protein [Clostridia bacterium]